MKFRPLYAGRLAMGLERLDARSPGIIATQSVEDNRGARSESRDRKLS
jgi:ornithine decarboxylase